MSALANIPDSLIARLKERDTAALEELVRTGSTAVYKTCYGVLQDAHDAEDTAQEVFLAAFESARRFEHGGNFEAWLLRIAVNKSVSYVRTKRRRAELQTELAKMPQPTLGTVGPLSEAISEEECSRIRTGILSLPAEQRAVLTLRETSELSYGEIAAVLELKEGTVTSRLARARDALRAYLERSANGGCSSSSA